MTDILTCSHISKSFLKPVRFDVLKDISLAVKRGEFVSVMGKSGCGKSTLLYILSTMDTAYTGELYIDGEAMHEMPPSRLAEVRNEKIGFVFQFHYLLQEFTVLRNVMLPALKLGKLPYAEIERRALEKLDMLGIGHQAHKKAFRLSGGEKQRVAIARALINDPMILMGDEPTGNLDSGNSDTVFRILRELAHTNGQAMLVVTHDEDFARRTDRTIIMEDGRIVQ